MDLLAAKLRSCRVTADLQLHCSFLLEMMPAITTFLSPLMVKWFIHNNKYVK